MPTMAPADSESRSRGSWGWRAALLVSMVALASIALAHALVLPRLQAAMDMADVRELPRLAEAGLIVSDIIRGHAWIPAVLLTVGLLGLTGVIDGALPALIIIGFVISLVLCATFGATYRFGGAFLPSPDWIPPPTMSR